MVFSRDQEERVVAAVAGDKVAMGDLLIHHYESVARHIDRRLPKEMKKWVDIDDLVQQSLVRAIKNVHQLQHQTPESFLNWLLTIVDHQVGDAHRAYQRMMKRAKRKRSSKRSRHDSSIKLLERLAADGDTPSRGAAQDELVRAVQVGIASLPDGQREAMELFHLEGKTLAEVATALHRTSAAVRGLLHRGRLTLRSVLGSSSRWFSSE
jgi:RNA polymerase sigma-70 factor (ECF subfamily)